MSAEERSREEAVFVVLYRWRLKAGSESSFAHAWSRVTEHYREEHGSLGSRLHLGSDGLWYGYAQWPSAEARKAAFSHRGAKGQGSARLEESVWREMEEATEERFPEIVLDTHSDFLVLPERA